MESPRSTPRPVRLRFSPEPARMGETMVADHDVAKAIREAEGAAKRRSDATNRGRPCNEQGSGGDPGRSTTPSMGREPKKEKTMEFILVCMRK